MIAGMVIRTRLRAVVTAVGLYLLTGMLVAYFGVHAHSGNHGLKAKEDLESQRAELTEELSRLRTERTDWERRVALLRSESVDPDMLDERARAMLDYVHPRDLILLNRPTSHARAPTVASGQ